MSKQSATSLSQAKVSSIPNSNTTFKLPSSILNSTTGGSSSCSNVVVQAVGWSINKYAQASSSSDSSSVSNTSTVSLLDACATGTTSATTLLVQNLQSPVVLTMDVATGSSLATQHTLTCPTDQGSDPLTYSVSCSYSLGSPNLVSVTCDGSAISVDYSCPGQTACAFWNSTKGLCLLASAVPSAVSASLKGSLPLLGHAWVLLPARGSPLTPLLPLLPFCAQT